MAQPRRRRNHPAASPHHGVDCADEIPEALRAADVTDEGVEGAQDARALACPALEKRDFLRVCDDARVDVAVLALQALLRGRELRGRRTQPREDATAERQV